METVRVDIVYRPMRICWAIKDGDKEAFRSAVRQSHALWGGRYNPIVIVDREAEAKSLVEAFRCDWIVPLGDSADVKAFAGRFPHLIKPFFRESIFTGVDEKEGRAQLLDVENLLVHLQERPEWRSIKEKGVRLYTWEANDPLADLFLMQLGAYPAFDEAAINYREMLKRASDATEVPIPLTTEVPQDALDHASISYFSWHGLTRHYNVAPGWDYPGFYVGDASNLADLVAFWNLRACDTALWFVDLQHADRYKALIPAWRKRVEGILASRKDGFSKSFATWSRSESTSTEEELKKVSAVVGEGPRTICNLSEFSWNGLNVRPPTMHLGEASALGVLITETGKPRLSFSLGEKPFSGHPWFRPQHLVASLSFTGGLYSNDDYTLAPPYVPELNEFYARTMGSRYNRLRIEPERIGVIVDAAQMDASLNALPVGELFQRVFELAGYTSKISSGGLIARQLISQLGGISGATVFKIPGVRRLLRTHRATDAFTKKSALQLIGGKDPDNPEASFSDHEDLYIEPRPRGVKLSAAAVFSYLVEKGIFRMGVQLTCPHCQMSSWTSLDALKQQATCEMCGRSFDGTRELIDGEWRFRRSGVFGAERNAQGAVPVVLTLEQLSTNLQASLSSQMYTTSLDLVPKDGNGLPVCEVDFVWMIAQSYPNKTVVILAECKDRGHGAAHGNDGGTIDEKDIKNLKAVADAFPSDRFETYVLLAKLCPFTAQEIERAKTINEQYRRRVILLTDRELEPYGIYDRTRELIEVPGYGGSAEDLALATQAIFFPTKPAGTPP